MIELVDHITTDRLKPHRSEWLIDQYQKMVVIRTFEDGVKFLFLEGNMPGTIHQCQGQEACAVGVCAALDADDGSHRPFVAWGTHWRRVSQSMKF